MFIKLNGGHFMIKDPYRMQLHVYAPINHNQIIYMHPLLVLCASIFQITYAQLCTFMWNHFLSCDETLIILETSKVNN